MACPQLPDPLTHPVGEGPPAARPGFLFGGPQTKRRRPAGTTERRRPLRVTRGLASQVNWPPFRPDTRHSSEGLGISSSTCLCRTIISGLN
jgi:hypothetical protein